MKESSVGLLLLSACVATGLSGCGHAGDAVMAAENDADRQTLAQLQQQVQELSEEATGLRSENERLRIEAVQAMAAEDCARPVFELGRQRAKEWFEAQLGLKFQAGQLPDNIVAEHGFATSVLIFGDDEHTRQITILGGFAGEQAPPTFDLIRETVQLIAPDWDIGDVILEAGRLTGSASVSCRATHGEIEVHVSATDLSSPPLRFITFTPRWKAAEI